MLKSSPLVPLADSLPPFLTPYLPTKLPAPRPFVTLTYAQSLDARIAAAPGTRTTISHAETKTMTHYLRAHHDAILIGAGTALADDPGLNCRIEGEQSPRPVIVDPSFKWSYKDSKMERLVLEDMCLAPWIVVSESCTEREKIDYLEKRGGRVLRLPLGADGLLSWDLLLELLKRSGIDSVMIEGGARVINTLLRRHDLVDSLVVTVGPVYLGTQGVAVSPLKAVTLRNVKWWTGIQDSIMAATLTKESTVFTN